MGARVAAGAAPPVDAAAHLTRRRLLQAAGGVGALYSWAGRVDPAAAAGPGGGGAEALRKQLEQRVTEFTLPNGLRFIVCERHKAPIVSFHTYADVGAYDEEDGFTGGLLRVGG